MALIKPGNMDIRISQLISYCAAQQMP